jgi:two-component system, chemotaxis family, protein-glutamate methylesterase/glutaminase
MVGIMATRSVIVIGASAGGVEALTRLCGLFPKNLAAVVIIALHITPNATSRLPQILSRVSQIPVRHARNGDPIQNGQILVAPPNHHVYINNHTIKLSTGPRVNGARPAIDVLFQSAAYTFGPGVIGVLLSGMLDDGTDGLLEISRAGGVALVQDPDEAAFASMPQNAIQKVAVDAVLPIDQLAEKIIAFTGEQVSDIQPAVGRVQMMERKDPPYEELIEDRRLFETDADENPRSLLICPDCGGVLWELKKNGLSHYRCQIGHAYSEESLVALQSNQLENALWTAVRALEERSMLAKRLANRMQERKATRSAQQFQLAAREADRTGEIIRKVLIDGSLLNALAPVEGSTPDQKEDVI